MKKILFYGFLFVIALICTFFAFFYQSNLPLDYLKEKYTDVNSKFTEINHANVHYRVEGSGPAVVLIHGTASSLHTWDKWTNQLKINHRVISLDLPGFGLTGPFEDANYTIENYVKTLNILLNQLGIDQFHLVGNSLGGNIAWQYALKYPEDVNTITLIDASGLKSEKDASFIFTLAKNKLTAPILKNVLPRSIIKNNIEQVYYKDDLIDDKLIDRYYELNLREGNRSAFIARARIENSINNNYEQLKSLTIPSLIIWGQNDEWIDVEQAYRFHDLLPNSKLHIIEQSGHVPMEEDAEKSLKAWIDFTNRN